MIIFAAMNWSEFSVITVLYIATIIHAALYGYHRGYQDRDLKCKKDKEHRRLYEDEKRGVT